MYNSIEVRHYYGLQKRGKEVTAQKLLDEGANVQAMSKSSQTPLMLVVQNGHEVVVKLLLPKGVDPDSKNFRGCIYVTAAIHVGSSNFNPSKGTHEAHQAGVGHPSRSDL
jgi:ankyrin repeat protein